MVFEMVFEITLETALARAPDYCLIAASRD
ncbi:hypothetical protein C7450_10868 [Chelatococcus asaccharovorans]|uniref:Uncharacterized protein n=1 Tax=Chelatococcus asaccharovorans TaxID=28210 RepID=A0A2V3U1Z8_9HYPH|nr:hypothetical protein C7450_10868 [Chelatococcus asaccharovorans]